MYYYKEGLINGIKPDKPDPAAAKVLQEALGGQFGEMRTMMQYFFQSSNFRGKETQYRDLMKGVFLEEIAHVELVQNTINALLDESGGAGVGSQGSDQAPLDEAVKQHVIENMPVLSNLDARIHQVFVIIPDFRPSSRQGAEYETEQFEIKGLFGALSIQKAFGIVQNLMAQTEGDEKEG